MRKRSGLVICLLASALFILLGCEKEELVRPDQNRAPETILSVGPDQGEATVSCGLRIDGEWVSGS